MKSRLLLALLFFFVLMELIAQPGQSNSDRNTRVLQAIELARRNLNTPPLRKQRLEGDGDVFIGYGVDVAYGVAPAYRIDRDSCRTVMDTVLIYGYRNDGPRRTFAYTKSTILSKIDSLLPIVADSIANIKAANDAQNQIDVWNQVLALNLANIQNPDNDIIDAFGFDGGSSQTKSSVISVLETNFIEGEHYIENTMGMQSVIEFAGTGVRDGVEYKSSKRFGKTENQTTENARTVNYTLKDDDPKTSDPEPVDVFDLQVVRDPMYGTPIFRLQNGTRSSCPTREATYVISRIWKYQKEVQATLEITPWQLIFQVLLSSELMSRMRATKQEIICSS